jgi:hypothetical protein
MKAEGVPDGRRYNGRLRPRPADMGDRVGPAYGQVVRFMVVANEFAASHFNEMTKWIELKKPKLTDEECARLVGNLHAIANKMTVLAQTVEAHHKGEIVE